MPQFQTDMNTLATYSGQQVSLADTARIAAEQAKAAAESARSTVVTRANEVATNTNTVVARADEVAANTQEVANNTQQVATNAQAVADALASIADGPVTSVNGKTGVVSIGALELLPAIAGNARRALIVNGDGTGVEWGETGQKIGDVLVTARNPGASYLPANGSIYLQSAYPALFATLGLLGAGIGDTWISRASIPSGLRNGAMASGKDGVVVAAVANTIQRSTDKGVTWVSIALPGVTASHQGYAVATDGKGVWLVTGFESNARLFRSTDNGLTWAAVTIPVVGLPNGVTTDGGGVWVIAGSSSSNTLIRSADNGLTWSTVHASSNTPNAIATDRNGTWIAGNWKSIDNGATWSQKNTPVAMQGIATDGKGVWVLVGSNSSNGGLRRSTDKGETWATFTAPGFLTTETIYSITTDGDTWLVGGSAGKVCRGTNSAQDWSAVTPGFGSSELVHGLAFSGGTAIAAGNAGLVRASNPTYLYDTATQFKLPDAGTIKGLTPYIKALEAA